MTYVFETLLARVVIFADALLAIFVKTPTPMTPAALGTNCTAGHVYLTGGLTDCGTTLVNSLGAFINQAVAMLSGLMSGLSVIKY